MFQGLGPFQLCLLPESMSGGFFQKELAYCIRHRHDFEYSHATVITGMGADVAAGPIHEPFLGFTESGGVGLLLSQRAAAHLLAVAASEANHSLGD